MALHPIPEDRAAWLETRKKYIGGSEIAVLFPGFAAAYQPSPYALHHLKRGTTQAEDLLDNTRVLAGMYLESGIAKYAAALRGWTISPGMVAINDHCPGSASTLDFIIEEPGPEEVRLGFSGRGNLQIKNVDGLQHRDHWGDEPPAHIVLQALKEMWDAELEWGCVVSLIGGNRIEVYHYTRDRNLEAEMAKRINRFWEDVYAKREPPIDGHDSTKDTLAQLYPVLKPAAEVLDLTTHDGLSGWIETYRKQRAAEKAAEAAKKEASNMLLSLCGPYRRAKVGEGMFISVALTPEKAPTKITKDMIGMTIGGRKESRSLRLVGFDKGGEDE